jgi:hypothetical protein
MSRRTFRRAFACLLLAVPALALSGCDTSGDNCDGRSPTYDETFFVANLRRSDGTRPPPGTSCEELCFLAAGYEQVPCRVDSAGTPNESVTCTVNFVCEE